jgi:hypothetical protein
VRTTLEKTKEYNRLYYQRNREKSLESSREWFINNQEAHRSTTLKYLYGITLEDYNRILKEQQDCCSICGREAYLFRKRLHVDHNHTTGKVRGLLCTNCNTRLGFYEMDNTKFSEYLRSHA